MPSFGRLTTFFLIAFTFFLFYLHSDLALSQSSCSHTDYDCLINEIQKEIDLLRPAQERNKQELSNLKEKIRELESRINTISQKLKDLEQSIIKREKDLLFTKIVFEQKTANYYKFMRIYDPITPFLSAQDATQALREINFRQKAAEEDRKLILKYTQDILELKRDKELLAKSKDNLDNSRRELTKRADFLGGEIKNVESYLASLTAKQQQFIALKQASLKLPTTLGAGPLYCTDDRNLEPGFRPAFAFYTFGIPHRVGMNQYGAYGRAKAGQNHEEILKAYFNNINFETRPNININVEGYGTMPLETYLLGVYEMPESWPIEAQKAQAIAARSYALAYTENGSKPICTTQRCQVYKQPPKSGLWKQAVEETSGKVMVSGGQVITAWYASTAGGYTFSSADVGWSSTPWTKRLKDTQADAAAFGDLFNLAYDRDSPCFYSAQGWRSEFGKSAWLKDYEVADIANVILLARADSSTKSHLYQVDKPNPEGVETWDYERVKAELKSRGIIPIDKANEVVISGVDWTNGMTTEIQVNGISFSGAEWKNFFNLRAPANIQIVGPLFNVERK